MRAIMMAAGVGSRLYGRDGSPPNKALLTFGGRSLLERHVEALRTLGVQDLTLVVGYQPETLGAELERIGALDYVHLVYNPRFRLGTMVSLWTARRVLTGGEDVLIMDADVLYDPGLLRRLIDAPPGNHILFDRDFEPTDEPVKLCLAGGRPVEFRKTLGPAVPYDTIGEWPGFSRYSPAGAARLAAHLETFVAAGRLGDPCEEAMRADMLAQPEDYTAVDVSGLAWIEIDFPTDVERAERMILPRIGAAIV